MIFPFSMKRPKKHSLFFSTLIVSHQEHGWETKKKWLDSADFTVLLSQLASSEHFFLHYDLANRRHKLPRHVEYRRHGCLPWSATNLNVLIFVGEETKKKKQANPQHWPIASYIIQKARQQHGNTNEGREGTCVRVSIVALPQTKIVFGFSVLTMTRQE